MKLSKLLGFVCAGIVALSLTTTPVRAEHHRNIVPFIAGAIVGVTVADVITRPREYVYVPSHMTIYNAPYTKADRPSHYRYRVTNVDVVYFCQPLGMYFPSTRVCPSPWMIIRHYY